MRVSCGEQVNALSALCQLMMMLLLLLAATLRMLHIHTPRSPASEMEIAQRSSHKKYYRLCKCELLNVEC